MQQSVDALIVGGGPGGLFMAARLAERGRADAGVRGAFAHRRPGPLHRRPLGRQPSRGSICRTARLLEPADQRCGSVSPGGIPRRLRDAVAAGDGDRPAGFRSRAGGSRDPPPAPRSVPVRASPALEIQRAGVAASIGGAQVHARLAVLACGASYAFQRRFGFGLPRTYLHTGAARGAGIGRRGGHVELHSACGLHQKDLPGSCLSASEQSERLRGLASCATATRAGTLRPVSRAASVRAG